MWRVLLITALTLILSSYKVVEGNTEYCEAIPDAPNPPPYPEVPIQYTANLEVITSTPINAAIPDERTELYLKEVYDEPSNRIAMEFRSKTDLLKYLLDWDQKQMLEIIVSKSEFENRECAAFPLDEAVMFFPPIWGSGHNLSVSHIIGPGALMGILNWTDTQYKGKTLVRGMKADRWDWCGLTRLEDIEETHNISMATYWSDREWTMSVPFSVSSSLPLGWEVQVRKARQNGDKGGGSVEEETENLVHNVMSFVPGVVDPAAFLIPPGVFCEGMNPREKMPFPDFALDKLFVFSMEASETGIKEFTWADAWYDFEKQLYRTDHDTKFDGKNLVPTTQIFDFADGIAYTSPMESGKCTLTILNDTKADWVDITGIGHLWADNPGAFFGTDVTNYTYYGPWVERFIKGSEWRGLRQDWPSAKLLSSNSNSSKTLWQWVFSNKNVSSVTSLGEHVSIERQVPIELRVTAMEPIDLGGNQLPKGYSYVYRMYNFNLELGERSRDLYSDGGVFDVTKCYSTNWREHLKFKLDVSSWPEVVESPLLTSGVFREYWQKDLASIGQVSLIRITKVKTIFEESGEVWVEFILLYRHPEIGVLSPSLFEAMTPGEKARRQIKDAVDDGNVRFEGQRFDGELFALVAEKGSLTTVIEPNCTTTTPWPYTEPTEPTTTTTEKPHGSTVTPPGGQTTLSSGATDETTTTPTHEPPKDTQYSPGALAGLGIGMLAVGAAVGSGATYMLATKSII